MAKGMYVGIETEVPVYNITADTTLTTADQISQYFTIANGTGNNYFKLTNGYYYSQNYAPGSTATTTLTAKQDCALSFNYGVSSEARYDELIIKVANQVIAQISGETTGSWSGDIQAGQTINFTYSKDNSQDDGNDEGYVGNFHITIKTLVGVETKSFARAVRKMYIGIDGLARKVKKAYIGIGGRAMPFFQKGGTLTKVSSMTYYPNIDARYNLAATTVGNCAMFGGGYLEHSPWYSSDVVCFSPALTRTTTSLSVGRHSLGATTIGNYAVFAGGENGSSYCATVDAFTVSGDRLPATNLSVARPVIGATAGNYAIFVSAKPWDQGGAAVDAYNSSLVKNSNIVGLPADYLLDVSGTNINKNLAIFASCYDWAGDNHIFITYDSSLTKHEYTNINTWGYDKAAASINGRAIFFGGKYEEYYDDEWYDEETGEWVPDTSYYYNTVSDVCAIDSSITLTRLSVSSYYRWGAKGVTLDDSFAIFGGGADSSWSDYDGSYSDCSSSRIDVYDYNFTKLEASSIPSHFSYARQDHTAAAVGDYAIFSGGQYCDIDDDNYGSYSEIAGDGCPEIYKLI